MKKLIRSFVCLGLCLGLSATSQAIAQQRAPIGTDNDAEYLAFAHAMCDGSNYSTWGYTSFQQCFDDIMVQAPDEGVAPSLVTLPAGKVCYYPGGNGGSIGFGGC